MGAPRLQRVRARGDPWARRGYSEYGAGPPLRSKVGKRPSTDRAGPDSPCHSEQCASRGQSVSAEEQAGEGSTTGQLLPHNFPSRDLQVGHGLVGILGRVQRHCRRRAAPSPGTAFLVRQCSVSVRLGCHRLPVRKGHSCPLLEPWNHLRPTQRPVGVSSDRVKPWAERGRSQPNRTSRLQYAPLTGRQWSGMAPPCIQRSRC